MRGKFPRKSSKCIVLVAFAALLTGGSGCSLPNFGPLTPLIKLGYNAFASMFNGYFFGTGNTTDVSF